MRTTELSPALGVEIHDLDAREPLDEATADELRRLYDRHHLLLLRGQQLLGDDQVRFAAHFGPIVSEKSGRFGYVSNVRPDGLVREGALLFHSDFAFAREPLLGITLHALDVPADGAATLFANAVRAVTLLPPQLRGRVDGRRVVNQYDFKLPDDRRHRRDELAPGSPITEYDAIAPHLRTGVPVLYVNEMHSERIIGLSVAESDQLLDDIFSVLYDESNVYEHRWITGDLVVWDNVALHHGRRTIPLDEPRTLQRVALGNHTAIELVPNLAELLA